MAAVLLPLLLSCRSAGALTAAGDSCTSADVTKQASDALSLAQPQKRYADAETAASAVLAKCPTQPTAVQALGLALVAEKKYDDAISRMTSVINAKPDVAYAYLWRGQAYYNKKQPDRMVGDFETFLKLAPGAPEAASVKQLLGSLKK
jgi:tetratricopeptide (TPR) repeat protein